MSTVRDRLLHPKPTKPRPPSSFVHRVVLPYHPDLSSQLKRTLNRYNIDVTFSSSTTLRDILTQTKSSPPTDSTPNSIYSIPCLDCKSFYVGQTKRPVIKRIKEHESNFYNNSLYQADGKMKSAPAIHARETGHTMDWNSTSILSSSSSCLSLNLLEQAAIHTLQPTINRTDKVPSVNIQWTHLLPRISKSYKPRPADISIKLRSPYPDS